LEQRAEIQKNHHIESPKARLGLNDKTDGELYNIVNNTTLDEDGLAKKIAYDNRSLAVRKQKGIFEKRVKEEQARRSKIENTRRINRVSIKREDEINMRGYDAITNQPFSGVGAKNLAPSQKFRPLTEWQKAKNLSHRVKHDTRAKTARQSIRQSGSSRNLAESGRKIMQAATNSVKSAPPTKSAAVPVPGLKLQSSNAVRTGGF